MPTRLLRAVLRMLPVLGLAAAPLGRAQTVIFMDDFGEGPSIQWDNAVGGWFAAGGVYDAGLPDNIPATFTGLPFQLTDFSVTVDITNLSDGGLWLRSTDNQNGVLLVTGGFGQSGTGLYWHIVQDGSQGGVLNPVSGLFTNGISDVTITVTVAGDVYSAYVGGSATPATTLTTNAFAGGRVGLYDFSIQTFDNFSLAVVPEPPVAALLACGLTVVVVRQCRKAGWLRHRASAA